MITLFLLLVLFIVLSAVFVWFLISRDSGQREPIRALWLAFGLGALALLPAGFVETLFITSIEDLQSLPVRSVVLPALGVGIVEETFKFFPLALALYHRQYFNERTDGIIYFALAGFGFGLPENMLYTMMYGAETGVIRIVLTLLFHAATTGIVGYMLAKGKIEGNPLRKTALALGIVIFLHGLYDFGLFTGQEALMLLSIIITLSLTASLFYLYARARHEDFFGGLSVVGDNSTCRSCGAPNPTHDLFCTRCGKRA